jgi:hypothetical protein
LQAEVAVHLLFGERKRKRPRFFTGRPWVRERFDAVETPKNRMKKSRKAWRELFLSVAAKGDETSVMALHQLERSVYWRRRRLLGLHDLFFGGLGCRLCNRLRFLGRAGYAKA